MKKQEYQLGYIIPATALLLHYEEEGPDMPSDSLSQAPSEAYINCIKWQKTILN
jgi:hypothetical protein